MVPVNETSPFLMESISLTMLMSGRYSAERLPFALEYFLCVILLSALDQQEYGSNINFMVCLSKVEYNVQLCIPSARHWMHNPALNKKPNVF